VTARVTGEHYHSFSPPFPSWSRNHSPRQYQRLRAFFLSDELIYDIVAHRNIRRWISVKCSSNRKVSIQRMETSYKLGNSLMYHVIRL